MKVLNSSYGGNSARSEIGEKVNPTIGDRMFALYKGLAWSTYGPTETHTKSMELAKNELTTLSSQLTSLKAEAKGLADQIAVAGGPKIEGME